MVEGDKEPAERDLLVRFAEGDDHAFERLFNLFARDVRSWSLRLLRDPSAVDDVTVEAFWRAYRARARFDPSRCFGAWIRRIAINAARDHLRARRAWQAAAAAARPPVVVPADRDVSDAVTTALAALPARLRVVATLALVEEATYSDIAESLAIPIGTVRSRLSRAKCALRANLSKRGIVATSSSSSESQAQMN